MSFICNICGFIAAEKYKVEKHKKMTHKFAKEEYAADGI